MPLQTQVDSSAGSYPHAEKLEYQVFPHPWERTDLVVRTVFKIAEVVARRLVGSIPTRSRQALFPRGFYPKRGSSSAGVNSARLTQRVS